MSKKPAKKQLTMKDIRRMVKQLPNKPRISRDNVVALLKAVVQVCQSDDKDGYGRALFNIFSLLRGPDYVSKNFLELHAIKLETVAKVRDAIGIKSASLGLETRHSGEFNKTNDFLNQICRDAGGHFSEHYTYAVDSLVKLGIIKEDQVKIHEVG